jgi:ferric-dicitrate binding protein FerR (iron transport regulator)
MSDRDDALLHMGNDLELITSFLNGHLDPERVEQVRRRLDDDPGFRDLAAPMLLTWSVPKHLERHPRPAGELEKHWDEFTKRAGFAHQRRKARRRGLWLIGLAVLTLGLGGFFQRERIVAAIADYRDYENVAPDTGWVRLRDGSLVSFASGSRLRALKQVGSSGMRVKLVGTARFRAEPPDTSRSSIPELQPILVQTAGADVIAARGEFTVSTRGDTTDVEVHRPTKRAFMGFVALPTTALLFDRSSVNPLSVAETELARVVRGGKAHRVRAVPSDAGATAILGNPQDWTPTREEETYTAGAGGDVTLRDSTRVTLGAGARLSTPLLVRPGDVFTTTFTGSARFVVAPRQQLAAAFALDMPNAYIVTSHAEFSVATRGDTVEVTVFQRQRRGTDSEREQGADAVSIAGSDRLTVLTVGPGERAHTVGGSLPRRLPRRQ